MKLADPPALLAALARHGGTRVKRLRELNTFLDRPDRSLKAAGEGLRVRTETALDGSGGVVGEDIVITHKGPRQPGAVKKRVESELLCSDYDRAVALLGALGFEVTLSFEKHRERWSLDGCNIEIDTLPYLGTFTEIEGPTEQAVLALREKLGLADEPLITDSYIAILTAHCEANGISAQRISIADAAM